MYLYIVQTIILPLIYLFRVRLKKYNMSGAENYECVINVNKYDYRIFWYITYNSIDVTRIVY